jgi:hypothetical protein
VERYWRHLLKHRVNNNLKKKQAIFIKDLLLKNIKHGGQVKSVVNSPFDGGNLKVQSFYRKTCRKVSTRKP